MKRFLIGTAIVFSLTTLGFAQPAPQPSCDDYLLTVNSQRVEAETMLAHKEARLRQEFRLALAEKDKQIGELQKKLDDLKTPQDTAK